MPAKTTVKAGTTLTWRNDETISHTVTSGAVTDLDANTGLRGGEKSDGMFDEQLAKKGDTFSFTYDKPGTYPYYCDIHKGMNAEVVVTP
jgi:plastocyanin